MVERSEVSQMAKMLAIINGNIPEETVKASKTSSSSSDGGNVAAMKAILEKFSNNAEKVADSLQDQSHMDRPLRDAMAIEPSSFGVTVGIWQIQAKAESGRKLYDVIRLGETIAIAADLTIYEAAYGLARALNDGLPITSKPIRDLLRVEEEYANSVHDAIHSKYALKKKVLTEQRQAILEDKYGAAVRRAADARDRLRNLVENYPY
jgi:hypothetical protein